MPVQRTLFGRPVTLRLPPRRFQIVLGTVVLFLVLLLSLPVPERVGRTVEDVKEQVLESIPDSVHRSLNTAHKPPVQANSTHGSSSWFSDWTWRNPFSSSITLDENRAVLPPLKRRPFVYTYYEPQKGGRKATLAAEEKLLLTWRRAWWAQGFRPIVLGRAEAMNNPLYQRLRLMKTDLGGFLNEDGTSGLESSIEYDVLRWLAWGNMGTGVLMNWLVLPMAPRDDYLLSFLRRGDFTRVLQFKTFGKNLFCGEKDSINKLVSSVLSKPEVLTLASSVIDATQEDYFDVDESSSGVALYNLLTLRTNYPSVADLVTDDLQRAEGLTQLAQLINAHLHTVWQNMFKAGIVVLKPLDHMSVLVEPAMDIAKSLQKCSPAPIPSTCPPNLPCTPCEESEITITTLPAYRNRTDLFMIGSVPHPYTSTTLHNWQKNIDTRYVRRASKRDTWLTELTNELQGGAVGPARRIVAFKDAVAGDHGSSHSLWLTVEQETHKDLNWIFGFDLPAVEKASNVPEFDDLNTTALETPGDSVVGSVQGQKMTAPEDRALKEEREMLEWARAALKNTSKPFKKVREAVEAWNLAHSEAWKFTKAYSARRRVERLKWEDEERKFAGSEKNGARWGS